MLLARLFGGRRRADSAREHAQPPRDAAPRRKPAVPDGDRSDGLSLARETKPRAGFVDTEAGFDPYNSGAFVKKGDAWERVTRR